MSQWPATKANRVLAALLRIGWRVKRQVRGSHRILARPNWPDVVFAFHDNEEIGSRMLARIAKRTGLTPEDLILLHHSTMRECLRRVEVPNRGAGGWARVQYPGGAEHCSGADAQ